jgi:hypothetical protein
LFTPTWIQPVVDGCHVAARPVEACDQTNLDSVVNGREDDWNRCRGGLGGDRRGRPAGREEDGNTQIDKIGCQRRQSVIVAFRPAERDQ